MIFSCPKHGLVVGAQHQVSGVRQAVQAPAYLLVAGSGGGRQVGDPRHPTRRGQRPVDREPQVLVGHRSRAGARSSSARA